MPVEVGSRVGSYRLVAMLGRGGMGVVYLGDDLRLGRRVAVKVIAPELAGDVEFRDRFVRESRVAASLDHPNVIPVYEAGDLGGALALVMRYVDGADLRSVLLRDGPLTSARALRLATQVASALDAAHRQGLVHRDVKPGNIMITGDRDDEHVYLTDFGLSKEAGSRSFTGTGQMVGTLDYISPEQISGEPIDTRADVYSLACVVYQCLTGTTPYTGTDVAVMWSHLNDPPPRLADTNPDLLDLDPILAKALAKDPADRYPTAGAFVRDLGAAIGPPTEPPSRTLPPGGPHGPSRARRTLIAATLLAVLTIAAILAYLTLQNTSSPPHAGAANTPSGTIAYVLGSRILAINADGGVPRELTHSAGVASPTYSPNGHTIIFAATHHKSSPFAQWSLYSMASNGSGVHALSHIQFNGPPDVAWSPNGKYLAIAGTIKRSPHGTEYSAVFVVDTDGLPALNLTNHCLAVERCGSRLYRDICGGSAQAPKCADIDFAPPAWAPDSRALAFSVTDRVGGSNLYVLPLQGRGHVINAAMPLKDQLSDPTWSPDGKVIAFSNCTNSGCGIGLMTPSGTSLERLRLPLSPEAGALAWSPDGRWLAFTGGPLANGLYLANRASDRVTRLVHSPAVESFADIAWGR